MSRTHPELRTPPALAEGGLRVIALGGLGEIGRNMTVFEYAGKLLVVDRYLAGVASLAEGVAVTGA